jgi:hypothetical protein
LLSLGLIQDSSADLEDCTEAIEAMSGGGDTTIYRRERNYTGSSVGQTSISFDVSDFISDIKQIVLVRVRAKVNSWGYDTNLKLWVFETMPNITVHPQNYTYGTCLFAQGGGAFFNCGITVALTVQGTLTFSTSQAIFVGDFVLDCYYTPNNNQVSVVNQSNQNSGTINL